MKITGITKENENAFIPFFPAITASAGKNLIRIGAVDDNGHVAGALSARAYEDHVDLLSLYVLPEFRRQGCGMELIKAMDGIVKGTDYFGITGEYPENDGMNDFFLEMGFELFPGKNIYQTTIGDILRSPMFRKLKKEKKRREFSYVSDLSVMDRKVFDIAVNNKEYDPEWSSARIKNGKYAGCLLCKAGRDSVNVIWTDSVELSPNDFRQHTAIVLDKVLRAFPDRKDIVITMTFERKEVSDFVTKALGGKEHLRNTGKFVNAVKILP